MAMYTRVDECIYPEKMSCRGCPYSYDPTLFDGGCKLHYEPEAFLYEPGELPIPIDSVPAE